MERVLPQKSNFTSFLLHFLCILTILHYFLQCFAWEWISCSNLTKISIWNRKIFFRQQKIFFSKNICLKAWNMLPGHYRSPVPCHLGFGIIGHFGLQFYTTFFSVLKNAFSDTKNFSTVQCPIFCPLSTVHCPAILNWSGALELWKIFHYQGVTTDTPLPSANYGKNKGRYL